MCMMEWGIIDKGHQFYWNEDFKTIKGIFGVCRPNPEKQRYKNLLWGDQGIGLLSVRNNPKGFFLNSVNHYSFICPVYNMIYCYNMYITYYIIYSEPSVEKKYD